MALTDLPPELLEPIIGYAIPEGFESFALSCKAIYTLCKQFIVRHNRLRAQFTNFNFIDMPGPDPRNIMTAFDLIARIAMEPVVARYIRNAYFDVDSRSTHKRSLLRQPSLTEDVEDAYYGGAVARLIADSPYLKQAGLEWEEYWFRMKEELTGSDRPSELNHYSQHAAAFLLTLLPNVKKIRLPRRWRAIRASNRLVNAIVSKVKQPRFADNRPSLRLLNQCHFPLSGPAMDSSTCFLALPYVQSFTSAHSVAIGAMALPSHRLGDALETVRLDDCDIDAAAIADFLKHTPYLKKLHYSHTTSGTLTCSDAPVAPRATTYRNWDICEFVTAIECKAGLHLEELSVSIRELRGYIFPGKVDMRGFWRLRYLRLPLEIAHCNIDAATSASYDDFDDDTPLICELVPPSVQTLSWQSDGKAIQSCTLNNIFYCFASTVKSGVFPSLKEIYIDCPKSAHEVYKAECEMLPAEAEKVGVVLLVGECV